MARLPPDALRTPRLRARVSLEQKATASNVEPPVPRLKLAAGTGAVGTGAIVAVVFAGGLGQQWQPSEEDAAVYAVVPTTRLCNRPGERATKFGWSARFQLREGVDVCHLPHADAQETPLSFLRQAWPPQEPFRAHPNELA